MKDLTIEIRGQAGAGKTVTAHMLKAFLEELGAKVSVEDQDPRPSDEILASGLQSLKSKNVRIRTQQISRASLP